MAGAGSRPLAAFIPTDAEPLVLAGLASVGPIGALVGAWAIGLPGWFNDFNVYYLAARLVADGRSPYDETALVALGRSLGLTFVAGGGYSYPPPFAVALVPLAALPFAVAAAIFTVVSIAAFAVTIAWWLRRILPGGRRTLRRAGLAFAAGWYPPVAGSVFAGQANLLVVALMGLGLAPFAVALAHDEPGGVGNGGAIPGDVADPRAPAAESRPPWPAPSLVLAGVATGLAAIVKLAPFALSLPLALAAGRIRSARLALLGLVVGAAGSLAIAAVAAPASLIGAGSLASLFAPDPFWSNQSLNGAISRLLLDGDRTTAIVRADPIPLVVLGTVALAGGTATLSLIALAGRRRVVVQNAPLTGAREPARLALALALAIVAAALGAPKNSFWNDAPVVLAIALALPTGALVASAARRLLVAGWAALTVVEVVVDRLLYEPAAPHGPLPTLLSDAAAVALGLLWLALALAIRDLSIDSSAVRRRNAGA